MVGYSLSKPVAESMTANELSDAQAVHYGLDDNIRRMLGQVPIEQKQKIHDWLQRYLNNKQEVQP